MCLMYMDRHTIVSNKKLPLGKTEVNLEFTVTDNENEKAVAVLYIDGEKTGEVEIGSFPYSRGPGGVTSLKANPYTSVNEEDYTSPFEYTGIIDKINI